MKSFRRSRKGISPIFATLILIAIAVIAGVVVYMFTSGTLATMTSGGTAAQEKVAVQGATGSAADAGATVYAQYMSGGGAVTINGALFNDASRWNYSRNCTCWHNITNYWGINTNCYYCYHRNINVRTYIYGYIDKCKRR